MQIALLAQPELEIQLHKQIHLVEMLFITKRPNVDQLEISNLYTLVCAVAVLTDIPPTRQCVTTGGRILRQDLNL